MARILMQARSPALLMYDETLLKRRVCICQSETKGGTPYGHLRERCVILTAQLRS